MKLAGEKNNITVRNNPVEGATIKLLFNEVQKGNYAVNLFNAAGEKVYSGNIAYEGGTKQKECKLSGKLPIGVYHLQLINGTLSKNIPVLIR